MMTVEEKPDVTYNDVGGCKEQIEKMREVSCAFPDSLWLVFILLLISFLFYLGCEHDVMPTFFQCIEEIKIVSFML